MLAFGLGILLFSSCSVDKFITQTDAVVDNNIQFIEEVTIAQSNTSERNIKQHQQTYASSLAVAIEEFDGPDILPVINHKGKQIIAGEATDVCLLDFIEEWYGVPYRFGGTTKRGIDCSAFVQELYGEVYQVNMRRTSREQFATSVYVKDVKELEAGDLVFFKIQTRDISHVGVYLGDGKFVHASRSQGVVISDLDHVYWRKYYVGGGKIEG